VNFTPKLPLHLGAGQSDLRLEGRSLVHHDHAESDSFSFHSPSQFNHADAVTIPDAHLLFSGDYARSGNHLIISDHLQRFVLPNYFSGETRPVLVSPEGAQLDSRFVAALTGHVEYAQAGATTPGAKVVGHVVKLTGSASIVRNGVAIEANTGDTLYQTDIVQTGSNSTLGLVLDDGTAFNLSANARFMLNDFNYDPTSTSNHSLVSLLQGAATFVAGQVAKTGGMEVGTSAAMVGIRGTAVLLDINAVDGQVSISVADQQDGALHSVQVFKCVPTGLQGVCSAGDLIGTVLSTGPSLRLTPAANFEVISQEVSKTPGQVTQEFSSFQQVLGTYDAGKQLYPNLPQHTENTNPNSNTNTGTTKAAAVGSPPILPSEPPSTTVFSDASSTKGQATASSVPATLTINSGNISGNVSTASLTPSSDTTQSIFSVPVTSVTPVAITNTGGTTNLPTMTITGTAGVAYAGTTVTLLDTYNGVTTQVGTTTVSPGGVWTANVALKGDGTNSIVAQDASASSTSAPVVFTLDTTPPSVGITSTGGPTNQATQTISGNVAAAAGEAAVGSTVTLFDTLSGITTQVGTAPVGAGGNWSTTVKLLGNGAHSVVAQDTDAVGNTGASTPVTFTLAALLMVTIDPVDGNNVITFAEAHAAGGVPLSGTVTGLAANSTFQVTVTDKSVTKSYTATVNGTGTGWSATIPSNDAVALANGSATVSAQVTDDNGNLATAIPQTVTVAETLPTVTTLTEVTSNGSDLDAGRTVTFTLTASEALTVATGAALTLSNGATAVYNSSTGKFVYMVAAGQDTSDLKVTGYSGSITDAAGNVLAAGGVTLDTGVKIDTTAPSAPTLTEVTSNGSDLDAGQTVTFTLTASEALTVATGAVLTLNNGATAVYNNSSGKFVYTVASGQDTSDLKVTGYSGSITDAAGNALAVSGVTLDTGVKIDTTAPVVTTLTAPTGDDGPGTLVAFTVNFSEAVTVNTSGGTPTLTLSNGATASYVSGTGTNALVFNYTVGATGSGQDAADLATATSNALTLNGGTIKDAAGNNAVLTGATNVNPTGTLQIDTTAPVVTIGNTGGNTNQSAQTISGTVDIGDVGATVNIYDNSGATPVATTVVQSNGTWSKSVTLTSGTNSLTAQVTDAAGNTGTSNTVIFTLNAVGPTGGTPVLVPSSDSGVSNSDDITNVTAPTFTVALGATVVAGDTVQLLFNGLPLAHPVVQTVTVADINAGIVSLTVTTGDLGSDGSKSISAQLSDSFGNSNNTAALVITLDTTAPSAPTVSHRADPANGSFDAGFTVAAGAAATVTVNGAPLTSGQLAADFTKSTAGGLDTYTAKSAAFTGTETIAVSATLTDTAGNTSGAGTLTLNPVDTTAPAAPTVSHLADPANGSFDAGFTVAAGAAVTVTVNGAALTSGQLAADFTKSTAGGLDTYTAKSAAFTGTETIAVSATLTDTAGNTSGAGTLTLNPVDTTAPAVTTLTAPTGDDGPGTPVAFTVKFSEAVTINTSGGTPTLTLSNGATASYVSGTATSALVFNYTVGATGSGQDAADLATGTSNALTLNGGTIRDAAGNNADLTGATNVNPAGTLQIDTTAPTLVITTSNNNVTASNNTAIITFSFSETPTSFSLADTTATGGTLSNLQQIDATHWTAVFTGSSNTQITNASVTVTQASYQDAASNPGTAGSSGNFSVDTIAGSWANSSGGSWADAANWSSGTAPSSSTNALITPYSSTPYTVTVLPGTTAVVNSLTISDPNATLLDEGALSVLFSLVMSAGFLQVSNGGTLSIGGSAPAFTVDFTATGGNLVLGSSPGFTGTVDAVSTADGAVTITGSGNVTTNFGDAIDLTASAGTQSNPANLSVGLTGAITGAATGVAVIQNAYGNVAVTTSGPVIGQAGRGIFAEESGTGIGSILVGGSGNVTGTGIGNSAIFAEILNPADGSDVIVDQTGNISGGYDGIRAITYGNGNVTVVTGPNAHITGAQLFGIIAFSYGTGSLFVTTTTNDIVTSGSAGIVAQSDATSIPQVGGSTTNLISVTAAGTIDSGSALTSSNFPPAGIIAGYNGTTISGIGTPNAAVFGNVVVNNSANINATGGDGIRTFNFGNGNITINDQPSTTITAPGRFGITASVFGVGNISISTAAGDTINSGSSGIQANDQGTIVPSTSTVSVTALGTINSGFVPTGGGNGTPSGIGAGYSNSGTGTTSSSVQGNVVIDSSATINAALGFGVGLFNVGVGNLTATLESSSAITAQAVGVNAYAQGGGNVSITNHGTITVATGVGISTGTGNVPNSVSGLISVTNTGTVSSLGTVDRPVVQINNDGTQGATFTNSGTVTSQLFSTNTQNQALAVYNGSVTVNNSGTITGNVNLATATFNNNSSGTWNVDGSNFFGNGANVIINSGIINIADVAIFAASGTLAFENAGAINVLADSYAYIGGQVSPLDSFSGTFSIGNFSTLEFASSVAAGQTILVGNGSLTLDSPSTFNGTIAGLQIGDTIRFQGISIASAGISGSTLTVTETNSQILTYQLSGVPSGVTFSLLSADEIQLVPSATTPVTGSLATFSASVSAPEFYIVSNANISGSSVGFGVSSSDATLGGFLSVEITQTSSISVSGTGNGVNLVTTAGDSIGLTNAASITSAGGVGINTNVQNSGAGSIFIVDYGNVSGAKNGITANTSGGGQINIAVGPGATVTGTGAGTAPGFAIAAFSSGGNIIVDTSPADILNSGSIGINAQNQATSIAQASNSSISISAYGTINSGATPPSSGNEPGGIKTGYDGLGGANPQTTGVFGNIFVNNNANISAAGGMGIFAFNDGEGNISITDNSGTTITATAAGATTGTSSAQYGIGAFGYEAGKTTVSVGPGSTINSGSSGIEAVNQATSTVSQPLTSSVTVVALGSINSGMNSSNSDAAPAGIVAGFDSPSAAYDANVTGDVFVDFGGAIIAGAGDGIRAFNFSIGNVTVNVEGGASITATHSATAASNNAPYGVGAFTYGTGNIIVTTSNGDSITSGSSGIEATSQATAIVATADAVIAVTNLGTIDSGTILTNIGTGASGITAGFLGGTTATVNPSVNGTVIVNNAGSIDAALFGIDAFNYGNGNISVTNHGSVSGGSAAIDAMPTSTSTATIDNFGVLMGEVIAYNASFINETGADWSIVSAADAFTGSSTLTNIGMIESNGISSITGLSSMTNTGMIEVETGSLKVTGPVTGGGAATIFGATMEFGGASDAHVLFDTGLSRSGTVLLDDVAHFTGTVTGFSFGDTIDLVGIAPANVSVSNSGGLHVSYGTGSFALLGNYDPSGFSVVADGNNGTDIVWNHQAPFIVTNNFTVTNNNDGTTTVSGLQISDSDPGVSSVSITATTAGAASGTSVSPSVSSGSLASINATLASGIIYNQGGTPPSSDMVTLNATDNFGASETVNFVFNQSNNSTGVHLVGTSGNDVIFATGGSDVLTGGGGLDQFVFKPTGGPNPVQHMITDFNAATDTLDLRQFYPVISTSALPSEHQIGNDTLVTLDSQDTILLKNVVASSLHANDFIVHA